PRPPGMPPSTTVDALGAGGSLAIFAHSLAWRFASTLAGGCSRDSAYSDPPEPMVIVSVRGALGIHEGGTSSGRGIRPIGGRIAPESEAHDLVMNLFAGLSKGERNRLRLRTRAAMHTHAAEGRWLGGRPNYGYRLVETDIKHPRPARAAIGLRL